VDCVQQSPFEESEVIVEEGECKRQKPSHKEACTSNEPCAIKPPKRHVSLQRDLVTHKDIPLEKITSPNYDKSEAKPIKEEEKYKNNTKCDGIGGNGREID
jgi:hypothetical protein